MRQPVWFACGDSGVLLDFSGYGSALNETALSTNECAEFTRRARQLGKTIKEQVDDGHIAGITDIVPGLCSVLFHYDPLRITASEIKRTVSLYTEQTENAKQTPPPLWQLPVCYDDEFGPDLDEVTEKTSLTPDEVIARHCASTLEVAIMGFLPGLGYLTGVDKALYLPRRSEPRSFVPKGSVGLAMNQTVVYPLDSPGGWNLIGRMPIPLFDQKRTAPVLLTAGDQIQFHPVSRKEFEQLEAACADGHLPVSPTTPEEKR